MHLRPKAKSAFKFRGNSFKKKLLKFAMDQILITEQPEWVC